MTAFPVIGLQNLTGICYLNSAFQCLVSLKSIQTFLEEKKHWHKFLQMVQANMYQMQRHEGPEPYQLSDELIQFIYQVMYPQDDLYSPQSVADLLERFFGGLKYLPKSFANFKVTAKTECNASRPVTRGYLDMLVREHENSIDIGQMLEEAVYLQPGQACNCGQKRIHFYGELPQCLVMMVLVLKSEALDGGPFNRRSVYVKCEPAYTINGVKYEMKAAADSLRGDAVKSSKDNFSNKLPKVWVTYFEKSKKEFEKKFASPDTWLISYDDDEDDVSVYDKVSFNSLLPTQEIVEESSLKAKVPKDRWLISFDDEVTFKCKPRTRPFVYTRDGHCMSYVKRDEGYYHISDHLVRKVNVVETDDLVVLFYERTQMIVST